MQNELRSDHPDLEIEILGMNPIFEESGNAAMAEGRDIPLLQDVDLNNDEISDNFLTSWPHVYRDVVIVDTNNVVVDSYNLTINSLEEPDSYAELRQRLIDTATTQIDAIDDRVEVMPGQVSEIDVLANDPGTSRLTITAVTQPSSGQVEITTVEYPADLDSTMPVVPELVISEIVPGEYIELYNSRYSPVDLDSVSQYLVSGEHSVAVSQLGAGLSIDARGYRMLDWPSMMQMSSATGELIMYRNDMDFEDVTKMDDFVAWGAPIAGTRMDVAVKAGKWYGPPDGTLDIAAIQRIPGTRGDEVHSYDNHRPKTPGNAINDAVERRQVVRFTPAAGATGQVTFGYTVTDDKDGTAEAQVTVDVTAAATPWRNPTLPLDVNNDGTVSAADALATINFLNAGISGDLPTTVRVPMVPAPFVDCDGSNTLEPLDVLMIIQHLNRSNVGSGEPPAETAAALDSVMADSSSAISPSAPVNTAISAADWAAWMIAESAVGDDDRPDAA